MTYYDPETDKEYEELIPENQGEAHIQWLNKYRNMTQEEGKQLYNQIIKQYYGR